MSGYSLAGWLAPPIVGFGLLVVVASSSPEPKPPTPPTCIEARGPATDPAEHAWSASCASVSHWAEDSDTTALNCIESACVAFRGLP